MNLIFKIFNFFLDILVGRTNEEILQDPYKYDEDKKRRWDEELGK